jgi:hypothetical protein
MNHYHYLNFNLFITFNFNFFWKYCKPKIIKFVNYNEHKNIENWSSEKLLLYSPFKILKNSQLGTNVTWHDAYCQHQNESFQIFFFFQLQNVIFKYKGNR